MAKTVAHGVAPTRFICNITMKSVECRYGMTKPYSNF